MHHRLEADELIDGDRSTGAGERVVATALAVLSGDALGGLLDEPVVDGKVLGDFARSLRSVLMSPFVGQTLTMLASTENAASLDELRDLIESGQVTPAVERAFPLAETAAAIRHVSEGRARGKVVITISAA